MSRRQHEALIETHYASLVGLAYLVVDPHPGRHRRVLAAHAVVQNLAGSFDPPDDNRGPLVRLYAAAIVAAGRPPRQSWLRVRGLRFFPATEAVESLSLELELDRLSTEARAFWALKNVLQLSADQALEVLELVGCSDPRGTAAQADLIGSDRKLTFDPCQVRLTPVLRKPRLWLRAAVTVSVVVALSTAAAAIAFSTARQSGDLSAGAAREGEGQPAERISGGATEQGLASAPRDRWRTTARLDFSAWPARGSRVGDLALRGRAAEAWRNQSNDTGPGDGRLSLLFAGIIAGTTTVILFDGERVARYAETSDGRASGLLVARADGGDLTNTAAIAVAEGREGRRFLLAPWIVEASLRDLRTPGAEATTLAVDRGVTAAVPASDGCSTLPALQLRSSPVIAEKHAFLVADLGDLIPVHLTWMPAPAKGPARQPREVTTPVGLRLWAQTACDLARLRGKGLRSASNWIFAEQNVPEVGRSEWVCTRTDSWSGHGTATVNLLSTNGLKVPAGLANGTSACSKFGQDILATARWRSPSGQNYLLAGASRRVTRLTVGSGPTPRNLPGSTAAIAFGGGLQPRVSGRLSNDRTISPFGRTVG